MSCSRHALLLWRAVLPRVVTDCRSRSLPEISHREPASQPVLRPSQEQLAVHLISDMSRLFEHARLPLRLHPYRIVATSPSSGLIEVRPPVRSPIISRHLGARSGHEISRLDPSPCTSAHFFGSRRRWCRTPSPSTPSRSQTPISTRSPPSSRGGTAARTRAGSTARGVTLCRASPPTRSYATCCR